MALAGHGVHMLQVVTHRTLQHICLLTDDAPRTPNKSDVLGGPRKILGSPNYAAELPSYGQLPTWQGSPWSPGAPYGKSKEFL